MKKIIVLFSFICLGNLVHAQINLPLYDFSNDLDSINDMVSRLSVDSLIRFGEKYLDFEEKYTTNDCKSVLVMSTMGVVNKEFGDINKALYFFRLALRLYHSIDCRDSSDPTPSECYVFSISFIIEIEKDDSVAMDMLLTAYPYVISIRDSFPDSYYFVVNSIIEESQKADNRYTAIEDSIINDMMEYFSRKNLKAPSIMGFRYFYNIAVQIEPKYPDLAQKMYSTITNVLDSVDDVDAAVMCATAYEKTFQVRKTVDILLKLASLLSRIEYHNLNINDLRKHIFFWDFCMVNIASKYEDYIDMMYPYLDTYERLINYSENLNFDNKEHFLSNCYRVLALFYSSNSQSSKAVEYIEKACLIYPSMQTYAEAATVYRRLNQENREVTALNKILSYARESSDNSLKGGAYSRYVFRMLRIDNGEKDSSLLFALADTAMDNFKALDPFFFEINSYNEIYDDEYIKFNLSFSDIQELRKIAASCWLLRKDSAEYALTNNILERCYLWFNWYFYHHAYRPPGLYMGLGHLCTNLASIKSFRKDTTSCDLLLREVLWACKLALNQSNNPIKLWQEWNPNFKHTMAVAPGSDSINSTALNFLLLSKGFMLNTYRSLVDIVKSIDDTNVTHTFDSIQMLRRRLEKHYDDNMFRRLSVLDQKLRKLIVEYGNMTKDIDITWADVKSVLPKHSAAIEVSRCAAQKDSSSFYAYIVCRSHSVPIRTLLFKIANSENIMEYNDTELSTMIWKPLENVLDGIKNIYFSPDGELNQIPIESLPDYEDSTKLISDRYNLVRLSSTRELVRQRGKTLLEKGCIYGGLSYDSKVKNSNSQGTRDLTFSWSSDSITFSRGSSKPQYLPYTLTEAEDINQTLSHSKIKTLIYTDTTGTEASFKQLSGSAPNIVHIATHGFYYPETEQQKDDRSIFSRLQEPIMVEDKAMTHSGLLFAGANYWLGRNADTYNDGILTAQEIAELDLKNVDLVVLSACETGMGELKGDGVFGLQRGFKKAGVNSIMMSLWKVDDRATQMLMTQFYENWLIRKMSKVQALRKAQEYVRNFEVDKIKWAVEQRKRSRDNKNATTSVRKLTHNNRRSEDEPQGASEVFRPFEEPIYWAGFILLDGLN